MQQLRRTPSLTTGINDMPIWFYNLAQSLMLLIVFSVVFVVFVWMTSKTPMVAKDYGSAFALGLVIAIILHTGATVVGTGFTKGVLGGLNKHHININYKESRTSTLEDSDGQRSREH